MLSTLGRGVVMATLIIVLSVMAFGRNELKAEYMAPNDVLTNGNCLESDLGYYQFCYTELGSGFYGLWWSPSCDECVNWQSNNDGSPYWSGGSGDHYNQTTSAGSDGYLVMQTDGNLVLRTSATTPVWDTNTDGWGSNTAFNLQSDHNMVLYYNWSLPLWDLYT